MPLKENIIDKVVKPHADNKFESAIARIVRYDKDINAASILFKNPKNVGIMELDNVPCFIHKGVVTPSLKPGDSVYIMFVNGSIMHPYIIGVVEKSFVYNTRMKQRHRRKGAFVVDREYEDVEIKKYNDTSNVDAWIDENNIDINKYHYHSQTEPINECIVELNSVGFFEEGEVGLYHPELSSIVKLRNNGCIDIFTSSNQGIRINPNEKSIKFLSENLNFTTDKWYIESDEFSFNGKTFTIDADVINLKSKELNIENESEE